MNKKLLMLGGGRHQINFIKYVISQNVEVILSDYLESSPGHEIATHSYLSSTLDIPENIKIAKKHNIDGVITMGTDQPLVTMAKVADSININSYLSPKIASTCTNKMEMFKSLTEVNIPKYVIVNNNNVASIQSLIEEFHFPLIIKPIDSQGQRGISIINNQKDVIEAIEIARSSSKNSDVIVQEYLSGPEITISAWIKDGKGITLLITDRKTYNREEAVGVCFQHIYPSKNIMGNEAKAQLLVDQIAKNYGLKNGPLYIQAIIHQDKLFLVEATCRIGGGHEDLLIKNVTGINIYKHLLHLALNNNSDDFPTSIPFPVLNKFALVNFILAKEGTLSNQYIDEANCKNSQFSSGSFYYKNGYLQEKIKNSMGRVGYFLCEGNSKENLQENAKVIYNNFYAKNDKGENLVYWPKDDFLNY